MPRKAGRVADVVDKRSAGITLVTSLTIKPGKGGSSGQLGTEHNFHNHGALVDLGAVPLSMLAAPHY